MSSSFLLSGAVLLLHHELRWGRQNAAGILIWGASEYSKNKTKPNLLGPACSVVGRLHAPLHPGKGSLQKLHFHFHLLRPVLTIPPMDCPHFHPGD